MRNRLLLLAFEFFALTIPLTWLWLSWGRDAYYRAFVQVSRPILIALGVTGVRRDLVHDRFINYLPFLVLMVITPGLSLKRRLIGTLVGFGVIFVGHIGLVYASFVTFIRDGATRESMSNFFPALVFSDALPFILWAIIASDVLREAANRYLPSSDTGERDAD